MEDYSQGKEQAAILKALGFEPEDLGPTADHVASLGMSLSYGVNSFLDIGAWHAKTFSNTRALFELGWGGVLIEPSPNPLQGLVKEYGYVDRVKVIAAAVGVEAGMIEMEITDDAVSTSEQANIDQWRSHARFYGRMIVPVITIPDILNRFGKFDFVNIDAEGVSVDLLKVLLQTEMFPRCICVEHDNRIVEVMEAAQARGYKGVFTNQANVVLAL